MNQRCEISDPETMGLGRLTTIAAPARLTLLVAGDFPGPQRGATSRKSPGRARQHFQHMIHEMEVD